MKRVHVYCPSCRWTGKRPADSDPGGWVCPRCDVLPVALVRGTPPKGGRVSRPRLTPSQILRRQAAELVALADRLEQVE